MSTPVTYAEFFATRDMDFTACCWWSSKEHENATTYYEPLRTDLLSGDGARIREVWNRHAPHLVPSCPSSHTSCSSRPRYSEATLIRPGIDRHRSGNGRVGAS